MATNEYGPEFWDNDDLELWDNMARGFSGMKDDEMAARLFSAAWIDQGYTSDERNRNRQAFRDYGIENGFFYDDSALDWDEWRAYMGYERS